jgi:hypothetical protein
VPLIWLRAARKEHGEQKIAKGALRRPSCFPPETTTAESRGNSSSLNTVGGFVLSPVADIRWTNDGQPRSDFPADEDVCAWSQQKEHEAFCQTFNCETSVTIPPLTGPDLRPAYAFRAAALTCFGQKHGRNPLNRETRAGIVDLPGVAHPDCVSLLPRRLTVVSHVIIPVARERKTIRFVQSASASD